MLGTTVGRSNLLDVAAGMNEHLVQLDQPFTATAALAMRIVRGEFLHIIVYPNAATPRILALPCVGEHIETNGIRDNEADGFPIPEKIRKSDHVVAIPSWVSHDAKDIMVDCSS
jgi:hypothetical protein